ncbi:MAG: hypothetical protein IKH23_10580, partial [Clostridiales bacterium]|nr:hypothetical protein [Clostridiales bacterium]
MKKLTAILLALSILFTVVLSGCRGKESGDNGSVNNTCVNESVPPSEPDTPPTQAPKPVEGVNYIGVRVETEHNGGRVAMDLYMICN